MKILKFKLFESSRTKLGFKYSPEYVEEALYYLTDIGFKVQKISSFYDIQLRNNSDFINAEKCFYSIKLTKTFENITRSNIILGIAGLGKEEIYNTDVDSLSETVEEISAFCDKFEDVYHNISYNKDGIELNFIIQNDIKTEDKESEKKSIIKNKSVSQVENGIWGFFSKFSTENTKSGITPVFLKAQSDNLGESFRSYYYGNKSDGFLIKFFNFNVVSKSVQNTNTTRIEKIVSDSGWYIPRAFHTVEFRKVTEEDLKRLKSDLSLEDLKGKFLGLHGVILKIDYDKWLNSVKKDWEENFDQRVKRRY